MAFYQETTDHFAEEITFYKSSVLFGRQATGKVKSKNAF
ncbi:hypothetical protein FM107_02530 [Sphingobacterium sp. JB170]|nr:hypothetical protein FM107_02530 [Sphingobacterium sp. JB170]